MFVFFHGICPPTEEIRFILTIATEIEGLGSSLHDHV